MGADLDRGPRGRQRRGRHRDRRARPRQRTPGAPLVPPGADGVARRPPLRQHGRWRGPCAMIACRIIPDTEDAMARSRSRITRRRFVYLAASAGAVAAAARASAQSRPAGVFVSAKTTEAPSLDPTLEQALSRQRLDPLFYNRLVEWGHDGKLEAGLAESWTTSADGRAWTFKLRKGVKFHNGRPLTASDVKFSLDRILDPKTAGRCKGRPSSRSGPGPSSSPSGRRTSAWS